MVRKFNLRSALLTTLVALLIPGPLSAQIPPRLKRCLPYPTFADEFDRLSELPSEEPEISGPEAVVDSVTILGGRSLPKHLRQQLVSSIRHPGPFDADWLREAEEFGVRDPLQQAGYFRAVVRVEGQVLSSNPKSQRVAITMHINEGPRFYLSSLKLRAADPDSESLPFPYEAMRTEIPLQQGALFDTSKIRDGIQSLTRLFRAHGYIDFTAEPQFEVDEKSHRIALTLSLDPQKQYRLGKVEILGPDPTREKLLQSQWKIGDIFDGQQLDNFLRENKALLPSDVSEQDINVRRNTADGVVGLTFDFRECPSILNTSSLN